MYPRLPRDVCTYVLGDRWTGGRQRCDRRCACRAPHGQRQQSAGRAASLDLLGSLDGLDCLDGLALLGLPGLPSRTFRVLFREVALGDRAKRNIMLAPRRRPAVVRAAPSQQKAPAGRVSPEHRNCRGPFLAWPFLGGEGGDSRALAVHRGAASIPKPSGALDLNVNMAAYYVYLSAVISAPSQLHGRYLTLSTTSISSWAPPGPLVAHPLAWHRRISRTTSHPWPANPNRLAASYPGRGGGGSLGGGKRQREKRGASLVHQNVHS